MIYLLDTNIVDALVEGEPAALDHAEKVREGDRVRIPTIVRGECYFGLLQMPTSRRRDLLTARTARIFARYPTVRLPRRAWQVFGEAKRQTRSVGRAVGDCDLLIAATAILLDATLVTRDRDFDAITDLRREDRSA